MRPTRTKYLLAAVACALPGAAFAAEGGSSGEISWPTILALLGVLGTWSAVLLYALKVMLENSTKHINDRLDAINGRFESSEKRFEKIEASIAEVRRDYVKREDWVQLSTAVQAKLDVVSARLDAIIAMERKHA